MDTGWEDEPEFQVQIFKGSWIPIISWTTNPMEVGMLMSVLMQNWLSTLEKPKMLNSELIQELITKFCELTRIVSKFNGIETVMTPNFREATKEEMEEITQQEAYTRGVFTPKTLH